MGTCAVRSGGTNSGCTAKTTFDTCNNEDIGTCAVKAGGTNYGCTGKTTMGTCTGMATGQGNYGVTAPNACEFTPTASNSELPSCPATQISTAANPGAAVPTPGCSCGWDKVAVPAGKFCGLRADGRGLMMPDRACSAAITDGKAAATAACNCGTESLVPISAGQFCLVP